MQCWPYPSDSLTGGTVSVIFRFTISHFEWPLPPRIIAFLLILSEHFLMDPVLKFPYSKKNLPFFFGFSGSPKDLDTHLGT